MQFSPSNARVALLVDVNAACPNNRTGLNCQKNETCTCYQRLGNSYREKIRSPRVHVKACLDIVECIRNEVNFLPEFVREQIFRSRRHEIFLGVHLQHADGTALVGFRPCRDRDTMYTTRLLRIVPMYASFTKPCSDTLHRTQELEKSRYLGCGEIRYSNDRKAPE